jgi:hypothetical protein
MKNLANCKPSEFLKQTVRIKKSAEKWMDATQIMKIRETVPDIKFIDDDMNEAEKSKILAENRKARSKQQRKNLSRIFDAMMDENAEGTLELLALVCFVEPENVDDHTIEEYMQAVSEMLGNEAVIGFFTSLAKWGLLNI